MPFDENSFTRQCEKEGMFYLVFFLVFFLRVSSFVLLLIGLKGHHGSERVKGEITAGPFVY